MELTEQYFENPSKFIAEHLEEIIEEQDKYYEKLANGLDGHQDYIQYIADNLGNIRQNQEEYYQQMDNEMDSHNDYINNIAKK